jgi:hypothetical protein
MKPLESQFANWIDSFFHKDEKIPIDSVDGLSNELNNKYDKVSGENLEQENISMAQAIADEAQEREIDINELKDAINDLAEASETSIAAHNTSPTAHEDIRTLITDEAQARSQGDTDALNTANANADTKISAHNTSPTAHDDIRTEVAEKVNISDIIDALDSNESQKPLSAQMGKELAVRIDAANGSGGFIPPYDFGVAEPTQSAFTNYAMNYVFGSDATNHSGTELFNGTKVQNLFDKRVWQLANTPNTVPAIFSWEAALVVGDAQRDFTANPIQTNELTDNSVTDTKIGSRTITNTATDTESTSGTLTVLLSNLGGRIKSLLNRFNATTGHAHNGTDSAKIAYSNLTGTPTIPAAPGTLQTNLTAAQTASTSEALSGAIKLHQISKTGSYNDLLNLPKIPDSQIQTEYNATTGMGVILNLPATLKGLGILTKANLTFTDTELSGNEKFICSVSANTTVAVENLVVGKVYIIVVKNTATAIIFITRPSTANDSLNNCIYLINPGAEIEISVWYDGTKRRWLVSEGM